MQPKNKRYCLEVQVGMHLSLEMLSLEQKKLIKSQIKCESMFLLKGMPALLESLGRLDMVMKKLLRRGIGSARASKLTQLRL